MQILYAINQLINTICGGWADETLSARSYRQNLWSRPLIDAIFFWDKNHCESAYRREQERSHMPPEYRDK